MAGRSISIWLFVVIVSSVFQSAAVMGRRVSNPPHRQAVFVDPKTSPSTFCGLRPSARRVYSDVRYHLHSPFSHLVTPALPAIQGLE